MEEITNLWSEDTDENIVKTWLLGCSDGQTFPICNRFLKRITTPLLNCNFDRIEQEWDEIIGPCIRCKIDDPELEIRAAKIVKGLNDLINRINANPEKYFGDVKETVNSQLHIGQTVNFSCRTFLDYGRLEISPHEKFIVTKILPKNGDGENVIEILNERTGYHTVAESLLKPCAN